MHFNVVCEKHYVFCGDVVCLAGDLNSLLFVVPLCTLPVMLVTFHLLELSPRPRARMTLYRIHWFLLLCENTRFRPNLFPKNLHTAVVKRKKRTVVNVWFWKDGLLTITKERSDTSPIIWENEWCTSTLCNIWCQHSHTLHKPHKLIKMR